MILRDLRWRAGQPAEVSMTSQAEVCSACFISLYWLSFLIRDREQSSSAVDKARQFQPLLQRQITVVYHAAPSPLLPKLLLHLPFLQLPACGRTLDVMLIVMLPALWSRKTGRRGRYSSWNIRQQPHLQMVINQGLSIVHILPISRLELWLNDLSVVYLLCHSNDKTSAGVWMLFHCNCFLNALF